MSKKTNENIRKKSVIILAAGFSLRMGFPKFALKYNNKISFLEKIISEYQYFACNEIIVVVNNCNKNELKKIKINTSGNIKFVINKFPERERFYSIKIGLENLKYFFPTFIHNVDNPFINREILNHLSKSKNFGDYIVPTFENKGGHPILISEKLIKNIIEKADYNKNFKDFLKNFKKFEVPFDDNNILININTTEKYNKYFKFEY